MATYDYTQGAGAVFHQCRSSVWVPIDVDVPTIIASDSTLTTNATITADDIFKIYDIPAKSVLTGWACLETITAGTTSNTCDIGLAGGAELFSGVSTAAAAGTMLVVSHGATWGALQGVSFTATDTLDMQFTTADETVGRWVVWVEMVNLSKEGQVLDY